MNSVIILVVVAMATNILAHPLILENYEGDSMSGPEEGMELVQLVPLNRYPRNVHPGYYNPQQQQRIRQQQRPVLAYRDGDNMEVMESSGSRKEPLMTAETGSHGHSPYEYVDYGAYTGGYGAFGWYSDHPVQTYGHY